METVNNDQYCDEMDQLCSTVRAFIMDEDYESGMDLICKNMVRFPHAPQPHNLLAILLEKTGNHRLAMRHFQAALALDPDYLPAKYNLNTYGTFFTRGNCAFDESDIRVGTSGNTEIVLDGKNIGHAVYRTRIEYDEHGIGHVVRK
ncbi:MAG: hypothetical protein IKP86_00495 [Anaerolineaceae bacterium]|nr:hypothetical protein [Anaerolineaceae bacterium]